MTKNQTKKKILYVVTQSEFGGAQRYLFELVSHLEPQKYDITIAAGPGGDLLDHLKAQNCRIWPLKHLIRSINPFHDFLAYFELKKLVKTIKPDILQLCSTKAGILGSLTYQLVKKNDKWQMINGKCIYRIGGWVFTEDLPGWQKKLYIWLEKWTAKYKDVIINNCEAHRQLAIKLGIAPAEKIKTIYNGLDLNKLNFLSREEARERLDVRCRMLDVGDGAQENCKKSSNNKILDNQNKEAPSNRRSEVGCRESENQSENQTKNSDNKSELLARRPVESNHILGQEDYSGISRRPTPVGFSLQDLRNNNYNKKNNSSQQIGEVTSDPLLKDMTSTDTRHYQYSTPKNFVKGLDVDKSDLKHQTPDISCWIGCIANFYKNKGLEYLIRAMAEVGSRKSEVRSRKSEVRCVIIGDGAERQNLEKLIKELGLENQVILTGKIPNAWQYLKAFDIFVLPSIKEGQPWSILEAMAAGLAIIATKVAAIPEMLEDGESGLLVEPKNPEMIREKIEWLMKLGNYEMRKLGQEARRVVEEKFGIRKMIREMEELYENF